MKEKIDEESFYDLNEADFKELGLPIGPRKVLARAIAAKKAKTGAPPAAETATPPRETATPPAE